MTHVSIRHSIRFITEYGDVAECECDNDHTTTGDTTDICQANGTWLKCEHNSTKVSNT